MSVKEALIAAGVQSSIAEREAAGAEAAMVEFSITTQARAQMFLAQVLHESGGLKYFEEIASGEKYEGRTDLGNTRHGDGRRFKGRGPIQLTGRSNYRRAGAELGLALEQHPEQAAEHAVGWRIAGWYWHDRSLNKPADAGDLVAVTKGINGGTNGLESRKQYLERLQGTDCVPRDRWEGFTESERRWIQEFDSGPSPHRRSVLRVTMARQRKLIWHEATESGWDKARRRARWSALRVRTS